MKKTKILVNTLLIFIGFILIPIYTGFINSNVIFLMCFWLSFTINEDDYVKSFVILTKIYAVILMISLVPWLLSTYFGLVLPLYNVIDLSEMKGSISGYELHNHILYLENKFIPRFYSVFDEPGVVGTLSAFILFGHKYDFRKWYVISIFICSIFTYSLAFFSLSLIGILYYKLRSVRDFVIAALVSIPLSFLFIYLYENEPAFQKSIVDRVSGNAVENVDSRTGGDAKKKFEAVVGTVDFFVGIGRDEIESKNLREGQSYALFILERGICAIIVLIFCYISLIRRPNKDSYVLLCLFFLSFIQRPFLVYAWQIMLFSMISSTLSCRRLRQK